MQFVDLIANNVSTTFIKTNKFKTISIQVVFLGEFSKENATKRILLSKILPFSTKNYPTKKDINDKLNELYDMDFGVSTYPTYKTNLTSFNVNYINPKYINDKLNLHKEAIKILKELIFNPNIKNSGFDQKLFNEQRNILRQNIKNVYNNKNRYALRQLLNRMGKDEILGVPVAGNLEDLEKIDEYNLYEMYKDILNNEKVYIFVVGDFDDQEMIENLKILGNFKNNGKDYELEAKDEKAVEEVNEYIEKQNINQAKLNMGFRTNVAITDVLYPAAIVFNAMFGGTFQSDLTRVVREEKSLAYTIASQLIADLKILIVSAGIDSNNYKLTKELVIKELNKYKQGQANLENLNLAKEILINDYLEIEDSPGLTTSFYFKNKLFNQNETVLSMIEKIKQVTLKDIQEVALGVNLDTIFLLAGEDYDG